MPTCYPSALTRLPPSFIVLTILPLILTTKDTHTSSYTFVNTLSMCHWRPFVPHADGVLDNTAFCLWSLLQSHVTRQWGYWKWICPDTLGCIGGWGWGCVVLAQAAQGQQHYVNVLQPESVCVWWIDSTDWSTVCVSKDFYILYLWAIELVIIAINNYK